VADYALTIERHAAYLHATVHGDNTPAMIVRYMAEIREACLRERIFNVLIVVDLEGPGLSMLEVYKAIERSVDPATGLGLQVAYVDLNPEHSDANMLIGENVAMTRGIRSHTFRDVNAAREWLLQQIAGAQHA